MFQAFTNFGIIGKAIKKKLIRIDIWNPRDFANNKHRKVDSRPYGGGPGMVMNFSPLKKSIQQAKLSFNSQSKVIYLSPQGKKINKRNILKL
ncbi:tRNA (guanosine(37)-N1)-methyltransferase TrmD, partial [Buchnera aphidicola (Hormaphis cornu)]